MPSEHSSDVKFEIGHVLFIDIIGYSKLLITEQSEQIQKLKEIVRGTEQVRIAEAEGKLLRLPTGDGGALVFRNTAEAPVLCAIEIAKAVKSHPELKVRMGVHSGPVNEITDLNAQANIAGAGINIAQRVMDCGDDGHILLSRHVAEDLEHYPRWQAQLHDLGECEVKHGIRISVVNLYNDEVGNPAVPEKFKAVAAGPSRTGGVSAAHPKPVISKWALIGATILILTAIATFLFWQRAKRPTSAILEKSIAVLPFENLSSDKENAYFADGIQDEILTRLAKIADLKVISRTSTQKYKSAPDNLREVGRQLGVANLLEGSVQKISNSVHVTVQLIRAATDEHLWAESYNRKLDDVFGVEGEVASAIAEQLNARLTGAEAKAVSEKPTENALAYDAYLRGLSLEHGRYGYPALQQAATDYAEAVQFDLKFALAWARLAIIRSQLYFNGVNPGTNSTAAIKEAADRALALQPELGETWIAQGTYRYRVLLDYPGALQAYEEGLKRLPNGEVVYANMAAVERRLGRWREAEAHFRKAMELDPRNVALLDYTATFLEGLRRFTEAHALLDRALEISPDDEGVLADKAGLFQDEGRLNEAAKQLARVPADSADDFILTARARQATLERQFDAAIALIEAKVTSAKPGEPLDGTTKQLLVQSGYCQEWAGRPDQARVTFARAVDEIKPAVDMIIAPGREYFALAYAGLYDKENALEQARRAVSEFAGDAVLKPEAETVLAQVQARFGDLDSAITALPHLLEVPGGITVADLRFNPMWDPLRKDSRFQKLYDDKQQ
jgi:TolB-like protein/Tfp pilus assembly protein PilF